MPTQNRPSTTATTSIICAPLLALQDATDSPRLCQDRFINPTKWFRAQRRSKPCGGPGLPGTEPAESRTHQSPGGPCGGLTYLDFAGSRSVYRERCSTAE